MPVSMDRLKKDIKQLVDLDRLEKQVDSLKDENRRLGAELRDVRRKLRDLTRVVETIRQGEEDSRPTPLIDIIEEIMKGRKHPMKVVDLRDRLLKDDRVKSRAENFYAVIATAMNNSEKFEKTGPGMYSYIGGRSRK